jgi:hypothetical protein
MKTYGGGEDNIKIRSVDLNSIRRCVDNIQQSAYRLVEIKVGVLLSRS